MSTMRVVRHGSYFELYAKLPLTVLCAASGRPAPVERGHSVAAKGSRSRCGLPTTGSMRIANRTGLDLSLLAPGVPDGAVAARQPVTTSAEGVDGRGGDGRSVDPVSADMG